MENQNTQIPEANLIDWVLVALGKGREEFKVFVTSKGKLRPRYKSTKIKRHLRRDAARN